MNKVIHPEYRHLSAEITHIIENFSSSGDLFMKGRRNTIKLYPLGGKTVNVKSFKVPNVFNKLAYRFFRKSKAQRSYEYANILLEKGIGTPQPIAFYENKGGLSFQDSYYMSEQMQPDLTYRQLIEVPDYPERELILRQFTRFSFMLHEKGVEFKDHTPGNTLVTKTGPQQYAFFLVDLNRMSFHKAMPLKMRIENMGKLTSDAWMVSIMSDEYAKAYGCTYQEVHGLMSVLTKYYANRFERKRAIKRALGLRKK